MLENITSKANLYKLQKQDYKKCAELLTDSLFDDPMMYHIFREDKLTKKNVLRFYKVVAKSLISMGIIYGTSENLEGVVAWQPAGEKGISRNTFIKNGAIGLLFTIGRPFLDRLEAYEELAEKIRLAVINEPFWYLFVIAVDKNHRSKGYASKLIKPFLTYFYENNISSYLETHKEVNTKIYQKLGYTIKDTVVLPETEIIHYAMKKE